MPPGGSSAWSRYDQYRNQSELYVSPAGTRGAGVRRSARDPRGVFASVCSAAAFVFAALPWYRLAVTSPLSTVVDLRLYSVAYRGWYLAIPVGAGLGVVIGAINALLRPGERGSLPLYVIMQGLALVTIGLIVAAIVVRQPASLHHGNAVVSLLWPAWAALAASVVALVVTLASGLDKAD